MALAACGLAIAAVAEDTILDVADGVVYTNSTTALPAGTTDVDSLIKRGGGTYYAACFVGVDADGNAKRFKEIIVEEGTLVLATGDRNDANCRTKLITVKPGATVQAVMNPDRSTKNRDAMFQFYRCEPALAVESGGTFDFNNGSIEKATTISGTGTLQNPTGTLSASRFTNFLGDILYRRATGSCSSSFGNGNAANDFDFSKITRAEIDIGYTGSGELEAGRWTFNNANPTHFDFFPFVCTFPASSAAGKAQMALYYIYGTITIDDCFMENIQPWIYGNLTINGGKVRFRPKVNQSCMTMQKGSVVRITGGDFAHSIRTSNRNYAISESRIKSNPGSYNAESCDADLTIDGGEHWYNGSCAYRTTFNGGRVWWGELNGSSSVTCCWNGATIYLWGDSNGGADTKIIHESSSAHLAMGAKGGRFEIIAQKSTPSLRIRRPLYSGVAEGTDGGLALIGSATWKFEHPCEFTGPLRVLDGAVYVSAGTEATAIRGSDHPFGYGDLILGNASLSYGHVGDPVMLAHAAGKALRLAGSACIYLPRPTSTATPFTVGATDAAATTLVRETGGVLFLALDTNGDIDGAASTFKVNGGVPVAATGLPKVPVFHENTAKMASYVDNLDFMRYDASLGFVKFADYACTNEVGAASGAKTVLLRNAKTTVSAAEAAAGALKVERDYWDYSNRTGLSLTDGCAQLYLEAGAKLAVGDGTNPASVILNSYNVDCCAAIKGEGTIDFGTSEGVFAVNGSRAIVGVPIAGSGGVTFAGTGGSPGVWLGSASDYTGGTRIHAITVQPTVNGSFGTGDIWIGEGKQRGGRIEFCYPGIDLTNRLHLAGFGSGSSGNRLYGAIHALASATVSGPVELTGNSKVVVGAEGRLTFSNVISGDWGLRIYNSTANTTVEGVDTVFARDGVGPVVFAGANTYKGITEVIRSTLILRGPCSTGTDRLELDSGRLRFENRDDVAYTNRVIGSGVIQLAGRGVVSFAGNLEGQEDEQLTLDLARVNVAVNSLDGIGAITTSRTAPTHLSVLNDAPGSFTGTIPANVTLHYGEVYRAGCAIIIK